MTQTATIQITNNTIPLPADWGTDWNGLSVSITKIDNVLVVTPEQGASLSAKRGAWESIAGILPGPALPDPAHWQREIRNEWERALP